MTIQVYVRDSSSGVSTSCDPPGGHLWNYGDVFTFLCGATADEVYVKEISGYDSWITLRKIAVMKEFAGCDDNSLVTPVTPADMEAQVVGEPATFEFSALTQDCGIASFELLDAPEWATLVVDTSTLDAVITIAPTLNS